MDEPKTITLRVACAVCGADYADEKCPRCGYVPPEPDDYESGMNAQDG